MSRNVDGVFGQDAMQWKIGMPPITMGKKQLQTLMAYVPTSRRLPTVVVG